MAHPGELFRGAATSPTWVLRGGGSYAAGAHDRRHFTHRRVGPRSKFAVEALRVNAHRGAAKRRCHRARCGGESIRAYVEQRSFRVCAGRFHRQMDVDDRGGPPEAWRASYGRDPFFGLHQPSSW